MSQHFTTVRHAEGVRCRTEEGGNFLLYHPKTDQLHIVSNNGKAIFDQCDGKEIDDVVHLGGKLLAQETDQEEETLRSSVLVFLQELNKRNLIEFE
ncbi:Coenzyme PQQ synthesis protein D (PqqD) [Pseudovibrio denitrificans]|uniref:Coenzyme PQQ synthesis protein D (PqqD) n=1 Tax=Pseudovibrio denitrificans TaxID=258256 RepID=A0A1I7DYH6_9HYPH|nr:PqqD family protein [Pseudovibrio denitrificans]SFU16724.1 Coenzyme PQQ synthesis protein D (PqqD) [Pseudovibrio denitrificans]